MTLLQVLSPSIGMITYPYVIRILGKESYGLYIFAFAITSLLGNITSFGFGFPSMKEIIKHKNDRHAKSEIVSSVFTAKLLSFLLSVIVFVFLILFIPKIHNNWKIFSVCFIQVIGELFFPVWYFQAIQKMKIVTLIQLSVRLIAIPFIFIFINKPEDNCLYAFILSLSVIFGSFIATYILWEKEDIRLRFIPIRKLKSYFTDALPFFWSSSAGSIKDEGATLLIVSFFGLADVALYDLAKKIVEIPRKLVISINGALFPKVIQDNNPQTIKKIIRYESIMGLLVTFGIALFGYWIILLFGGENMLGAYPLSIILSITILVRLIVTSHVNFIFVPRHYYYFATYNQLVALFSFFFFAVIGLIFSQNIYVVVSAMALSGLLEILYCQYTTQKYRLI